MSGLAGQVLLMAKIHLFAYALLNGVYQTRATYIRWATAVYHATWQMELPTTPYTRPDHSTIEIVSVFLNSCTHHPSYTNLQMVNNIASLRGRVKDHVRPFVQSDAGFKQSMTDQSVIQANRKKFVLLYPDNFHCEVRAHSLNVHIC